MLECAGCSFTSEDGCLRRSKRKALDFVTRVVYVTRRNSHEDCCGLGETRKVVVLKKHPSTGMLSGSQVWLIDEWQGIMMARRTETAFGSIQGARPRRVQEIKEKEMTRMSPYKVRRNQSV